VKWIDEVLQFALKTMPAPLGMAPATPEKGRARRNGKRGAKQVQAH
jgi:hypothetical protein